MRPQVAVATLISDCFKSAWARRARQPGGDALHPLPGKHRQWPSATWANGLPRHDVWCYSSHSGKVMTGRIGLCCMAIQ